MSGVLVRARAACGLLGPAVFVGGWLLAGSRAPDYSPVTDAISDLAKDGAPTKALMTTAFIGFGVMVPIYAAAIGRAFDSRALTVTTTVAGLSTLAVAAFPLSVDGGTTRDLLHGVSAGTGYVGMALSPLLGGLALRRMGHTSAANVSFAISAISASALITSVSPMGEARTGLFQRSGLTVVDAWFAATAATLIRGRLRRPG